MHPSPAANSTRQPRSSTGVNDLAASYFYSFLNFSYINLLLAFAWHTVHQNDVTIVPQVLGVRARRYAPSRARGEAGLANERDLSGSGHDAFPFYDFKRMRLSLSW